MDTMDTLVACFLSGIKAGCIYLLKAVAEEDRRKKIMKAILSLVVVVDEIPPTLLNLISAAALTLYAEKENWYSWSNYQSSVLECIQQISLAVSTSHLKEECDKLEKYVAELKEEDDHSALRREILDFKDKLVAVLMKDEDKEEDEEDIVLKDEQEEGEEDEVGTVLMKDEHEEGEEDEVGTVLMKDEHEEEEDEVGTVLKDEHEEEEEDEVGTVLMKDEHEEEEEDEVGTVLLKDEHEEEEEDEVGTVLMKDEFEGKEEDEESMIIEEEEENEEKAIVERQEDFTSDSNSPLQLDQQPLKQTTKRKRSLIDPPIAPISVQDVWTTSSESDDDDINETAITTFSGRRPKKSAWTVQAVEKLVKSVNLYGTGRWKTLWPDFPENFSPAQLKDKWRNLLKYNHVKHCGGKFVLK